MEPVYQYQMGKWLCCAIVHREQSSHRKISTKTRHSLPCRYLTECYDELGTQYKVPIYCLSYPINIVKEDNGRDSPAEYSEPVDGGVEVTLKLRLSSSFSDTKLTVYSKDTIGQCKKKLQVGDEVVTIASIDVTFWSTPFWVRFSVFIGINLIFLARFRHRKMLMRAVNDGFTAVSYWVIRF